MQKYKTFIIFLILVAIWGAFFSTIKFFLWGELDSTIKPDLQEIAGYLSLGGIFAYLVGGAFAETFLKKYFLFIISLFSLLFICFAYFIGFGSSFVFAIIITLVGFLYGLWNVVKTVILAIEIKKTGLADTVVNALGGIIFVVFLIIGAMLGSILFEKMGHDGYLVIIGMLIFTAILGFSLDYDKITFKSLIKNGWKSYFFERKNSLSKSLKAYIPDLKYIIKNYTSIIIGSSFLWTISTIVSQSSIEYSMNSFNVEASKATYILLYSALGAIIGNVISMKMGKNRWKFFILFNLLFSILIILFPFLAISFTLLSILALVLGLFFGITSNLVDSYFLKRIGDEGKKEYGSSTYGLVFSTVIFVMMFVSSYITSTFSYTVLMLFLGILMLVIGFYLYREQT